MASYPGWLHRTTPDYARLLRTTPDYAGLLPDYFELRHTTSGLLRSTRPDTEVLGTRPEDPPGPRGNYLLDFLSPLCRFSLHLQFPYIQWRGLLPMLVCAHPHQYIFRVPLPPGQKYGISGFENFSPKRNNDAYDVCK